MSKRKRIISYVLCVALCLPLGLALPNGSVRAEETVVSPSPTQDGMEQIEETTKGSWIDSDNYSENWFDPSTKMDGYGNDGSENSPYEIRREEDFAAFSRATNDGENFNNKYIKITADKLDMAKHYWHSISDPSPSSNLFKGNFDGNDCEIWNVYIDTEKECFNISDIGLFGNVCGKIKNIKLRNIMYKDEEGYCNIGGLISRAVNTSIDNCLVDGKIMYTEKRSADCGGIVSYAEYCNIKNCSAQIQVECSQNEWEMACGGVISRGWGSKITGCNVKGTIKAKGSGKIGGICGAAQENLTIENCKTDVDIVAGDNSDAGGIIGWHNFRQILKISDTVAKGNISVGANSNVGGFLGGYVEGQYSEYGKECGYGDGAAKKIIFTNCLAMGNVSAGTGSNAGGFSGYGAACCNKRCGATGNVTVASGNAGGFSGYVYNLEAIDCYTLGNVQCLENGNLGGFVGSIEDEKVILKNCYVAGNICGNGGDIGGFTGNDDCLKYENSDIDYCYWNQSAAQINDGVEIAEEERTCGMDVYEGKMQGVTESELKGSAFLKKLNKHAVDTIWERGGVRNQGYPYPKAIKNLLASTSLEDKDVIVLPANDKEKAEMGVYGSVVYPTLKPEDRPIHISIEWGSMEYQYKAGDYDRKTNRYAAGVWEPEEAGVSDTIEIQNKSQADIMANFNYVASSQHNGNYLDIQGSFKEVQCKEPITSGLIIKGEQNEESSRKLVSLGLSGVPESSVKEGVTEQIGKIVLTIKPYTESASADQSSSTTEP